MACALAVTLKVGTSLFSSKAVFCSWALTSLPWLCLYSRVELRFSLDSSRGAKGSSFLHKVCYPSTEVSLASSADPEGCQLPSGSAVG